jgi:predicted nucleic acid-binding protein
MKRAVLDASVIVKWFQANGEPHADNARALRKQFEAGALAVVVPALMPLELLNVAGRRWRWKRADLLAMADLMETLPFDLRNPPLRGVAAWTARGLSAYDACYVAVAESETIQLITDDAAILDIASPRATPLSAVR